MVLVLARARKWPLVLGRFGPERAAQSQRFPQDQGVFGLGFEGAEMRVRNLVSHWFAAGSRELDVHQDACRSPGSK